MRIARFLNAALPLGILLGPQIATAQQDDFDVSADAAKPYILPSKNQVTVGPVWQSNASPYFGRFSGRQNKGLYGLGDVTLEGGDAWDSGGTWYWRFRGTDLGYESRSAELAVGQQGTWGARLYYDGVPYMFSNSFRSVWDKSGNLVPGVAPGSITNATTLGSRLTGFDINTRRDIFGATGKMMWGDWTISGGLRHEHKQGYKENSIYFGSAPISPTVANVTTGGFGYFGEPVNYDTDRYDLNAEYNRERYQVAVGYTYNSFTDNSRAMSLATPFAFTTGYGGAASRVAGLFSLPPGNSEHQIRADIGYNFTPTTRLTGNFQYSLGLQNDRFPGSTGNANLAGFTPPRDALDGSIRSLYGSLALTAQPIDKMDVRVSYTIDDRQNQTPRNSYSAYIGDTATSENVFNLPLSYRHQQFKAEVGYRVAPETKITGAYIYQGTHRTYADTNDVTESIFQGKIRSTITEGLFGALSFQHGEREAHNYNGSRVWLSLGAPTSNDFVGLVKFYEASRRRDEVKASLDWVPLQNFSATFSGHFRNDFYPKSVLGLRSNYNVSAGPDISWQVTKDVNIHAYYMYERYFFNQNDSYWTTSTCNKDGVTISASCNGVWNGKTTDENHTAGINFAWQVIPDVFKITTDYTFNFGNAAYSIANGGLLALGGVANVSNVTAPGPSVRSTLNTLTVMGEYRLRENMTLLGAYTFANFSTNDFAYRQGATQYTNALFSGDSKPTYNIHVVLAALRVNW